jgi:hypothetical protein
MPTGEASAPTHSIMMPKSADASLQSTTPCTEAEVLTLTYNTKQMVGADASLRNRHDRAEGMLLFVTAGTTPK